MDYITQKSVIINHLRNIHITHVNFESIIDWIEYHISTPEKP